MSANDGGAAFARAGIPTNWEEHAQSGMTLRQYYKGEALKGLLANPSLVGWGFEMQPDKCGIDSNDNRKALVFKAGQFADALLAEDAAHKDK